MKALTERVTLSRTGLTRLVDRIERDGLLRREPAPEDRRGAYVVITPAGIQLLRRMWPIYERVLDEAFAGLRRPPRPVTRLLDRLAAAHRTALSPPD